MIKLDRKKIATSFLVLFVVTAIITCFCLKRTQYGKKYSNALSAICVIGMLKYRYYQPVDISQLWSIYLKNADIGEVMSSLGDPYTRFLDKKAFASLREEAEGKYAGIGVCLLDSFEDELIISEVMENTPAAEAGLRAGDRIIGINGYDVKAIGKEAITANLRGEKGTSVSLRILRGNKTLKSSEFEVSVERREIILPTVKMELRKDSQIGTYAWIELSQFAETTGNDLLKKIEEISETDAGGIILDLRGNPGGALTAAVDVVGAFLPEQSLIIKVLRHGRTSETIRVQNDNRYTELPLIVLADEWSASASEIVAGTLKDHNRAILVGTHTFGKDLIQEVIGLPDGSGMTITIANYRTPSGVDFHKKGILPDKNVEIPGALDKLLETGESDDYMKMQKMQEDEALQLLREQNKQQTAKSAA